MIGLTPTGMVATTVPNWVASIGLAASQFGLIGSADAVRSNAFDVVVANINESVIEDLREEFTRVARRQILSGFQDESGRWTCVSD